MGRHAEQGKRSTPYTSRGVPEGSGGAEQPAPLGGSGEGGDEATPSPCLAGSLHENLGTKQSTGSWHNDLEDLPLGIVSVRVPDLPVSSPVRTQESRRCCQQGALCCCEMIEFWIVKTQT